MRKFIVLTTALLTLSSCGDSGLNLDPSSLSISPSVNSSSGITQGNTTFSEFVKTPVTIAKYNQVTDGMSYEQVKRILGEPSSKSTLAITGLPTSNTYQWRNPGNKFVLANVTFSDGKVNLKTQIGLE